MTHSRAQLIATLGPASRDSAVLAEMVRAQLDVLRLNLSWGTPKDHEDDIARIREVEQTLGRPIAILVDLPGPRVQEGATHTYDVHTPVLTETDKSYIAFAVRHHVAAIAVSFVGSAQDIKECKEIVASLGGTQKVVAKIERSIALTNLSDIIQEADAVMVARGDLGNEVPLEQIPFIQDSIVRAAKEAGKPVIVATELLLSMVERERPTRAEVTDVAYAILQGADAVMLSEETAKGAHPVAAVRMMEKIISEAEAHMGSALHINQL